MNSIVMKHAATPCRAMKSHAMTVFLAALLAVAGLSCQTEARENDADDSVTTSDDLTSVPEWSREAIWYQIFVERFRNGDASNDPVFENAEGAYPNRPFEGWSPTPWTHDWYRQEDWAAASGEEFYRTVQARRYGGDLQGVLDRLDYLEELGVTALYLNPINDAPSLHKYDARNYRHIDRNFGPDPAGDAEIMAAENPADPDSWRWTSADRLFLDLVAAAHERGMRIILDYSWNHTGITFWAWKDILENQAASPYADWYEIARFDDPATGENEFEYEGWAGVSTLPNLKKVEVETKGMEGSNLHPAVKQHVYHVTRRWMDPNGDGDPSDGIDGFRLDVAEQVPKGFWREYRAFVRDVNPDAYLVGEVWWEDWPDHMADPVPWVQGDVFDAVMNYRWYMPTRSFFAQAPPYLTAAGYIAHLDSVERGIDRAHLEAMMNLGASHDSPRLGTSLYNNQTKYKYQAHPRGNPEYKIDRPDERTEAVRRLVLTQQFTYYGAPHIWERRRSGHVGRGRSRRTQTTLVGRSCVRRRTRRAPCGGAANGSGGAGPGFVCIHPETGARPRGAHGLVRARNPRLCAGRRRTATACLCPGLGKRNRPRGVQRLRRNAYGGHSRRRQFPERARAGNPCAAVGARAPRAGTGAAHGHDSDSGIKEKGAFRVCGIQAPRAARLNYLSVEFLTLIIKVAASRSGFASGPDGGDAGRSGRMTLAK